MPPVIVVDHLYKYYRAHKRAPGLLGALRSLVHRQYHVVHAVEDISFTIGPGELVGFLGPNGAGKTTTLKVLSGLLYPTAGRVSVLGRQPWRREAALQRQFTLVMGQKSQLWWDLPAIESYRLNKEIYGLSEAEFRRNLAHLSDLLDLGPIMNVQVRKLSLGERMKCELAAALLHAPQVLFLDEPTIGLDVVMQKRIRDFVVEYNRQQGATVILTSYDMDDVKEVCDRVLIINDGRLVYDGRLDAVVQQYADYKLLVADFAQYVPRAALEELGEVIGYQPMHASLRVPRWDVSNRASRLLATLPVADLSIEEPRIEDVVRELFTSGSNSAQVAQDEVPDR